MTDQNWSRFPKTYLVTSRLNDGRKVANELHQLSGVELALVHQIAAVAQDHAHDAFHEQGGQHGTRSRTRTRRTQLSRSATRLLPQ